LNVEGAVRLAQALRTDLASALAAGTLKPGSNLLAAGQAMPTPTSTFNGQSFGWSQLVTAGGSHVLTGQALFTGWQPIYDPRLIWVRNVLLRSSVQYASAACRPTPCPPPSPRPMPRRRR